MAAHAGGPPVMHVDETLELLCPDSMSTPRLVALLSQRYFQAENLESLNRQELLRLVNEHIVPRPQRQRKPKRRESGRTRQQQQQQLAVRSERRPQKRSSAERGLALQCARPAKRISLDNCIGGGTLPSADGTSPRLLGAVTELLASQSLASPLPEGPVKPWPPRVSVVDYSRKVIKLTAAGGGSNIICQPSSISPSSSSFVSEAATAAQNKQANADRSSGCHSATAKTNAIGRSSSQEQMTIGTTSTDGKRTFKKVAVKWP